MAHILSDEAIREQKANLNRVIQDAQAQLADLELAERVVLRFGREVDALPLDGSVPEGSKKASVSLVATFASNSNRAPTTKALMQAVMRGSPSPWMTSDELRDQVSALKGSDVPMGTIGPTLSNLKSEGVIVRDGFKVALAERLNENGPPGGGPDAGGVAAPSSDNRAGH